MRYVLLIFAFSLFAYSKCNCECVNGEVQTICENSYDYKPVCSPRVCPVVPPSVAPIDSGYITPPGFSQCSQKQVYNDNARIYEWRRVCE